MPSPRLSPVSRTSAVKVDESAAVALEQVKAKGYDAPYRGKGLPIYLTGLNFDSRTRHLADAAAAAV